MKKAYFIELFNTLYRPKIRQNILFIMKEVSYIMAEINLSKYGITGTTEIVHNPSFEMLYEEEIKPLILDVARDTKVSTEALIEEYTERFRALDAGNRIVKLIEQQKQRKELSLKKKSKLLEYNVTGAISDADFIAMNRQCAEEIADAEAQIIELEQQLYSKEEFRRQIETMKSVMRNMEQAAATGAITKEFVDEFIDKIFATPAGENTLRLDIRIFTGEETRKYFEKLELRSGHTFKKMIEAYEQGLQ